ncbi:putative Glutamate-ammonia-ligase adenylyltransferase [Candidatus Sulfobium mesophilum]|uniref:Putative Glutamate-ammonia-ligase adenylyltransferase n=1 Tax=Candidatus Sulfobium mesophilum TaxID=2016548 RepID=A0A2U3QF05_9BACT|nr:putative Glutamate-ammonia-ligase adenylyltransferase [Candidatus Sulfobium mesophilum]
MKHELLKEAADATADPDRALNNLSSFIADNPSKEDDLEAHIRKVALLFASSQFLANYCVSNADVLFDVLRDLDMPRDKESLSSALKELSGGNDAAVSHSNTLDSYMAVLREFKMRETLRIALRDLLKKADLVDVMYELSALADVAIGNSLKFVRNSMRETYGAPASDAFSVIALGKLGGEELNFSSDVDLIFVYGTEEGETSGVLTAHGLKVNRLSSHEYYCKMGEALTRFLSLNTSNGFAYRVDLRLRPEGQRGDIALALRGYEMYYESWGRAWERAMLIRARPAAGDAELGRDFMDMIRPFVYRKYLDYGAIDEISSLKTRIDSTFKKGDIKRGHGGIREVEFFAQALQLLYGGREPILRERSTLKVLHRLLQKALIGQEDFFVLSDNYRFLRTLEHRLQQLNNLQTHTLPSGEAELEALGRKMGFRDAKDFVSDLGGRRAKVREIYDSLFSGRKEESVLSGTFFDEETSDAELREYLSATGLKDIGKAVRNIRSIQDSIFTFQTLRGRRLLGSILPLFIDSALKSASPDMALNYLQSFANLLSANESYLEIFSRERRLIDMLTYVFSQSEYLSKMLLGRPQYLDMIGWKERTGKPLKVLKEEIGHVISEGRPVQDAVRIVKQSEEIRLGMLFLQRKTGVNEVVKGLSKTAEAILSTCAEHLSEGARDLAVIGLGKLGGREITFGSDLDIIFVTKDEPDEATTRMAEKLLRMLISYTKEGVAYRIDTRLRPEGKKGVLVSSLESFRKYYAKAAAFWEFQALLKARPVAGSIRTALAFMSLASETLISRGREISASDILQMRERILRELSKEARGYDIKLGPGGIEDIEFTAQYLQLAHCGAIEKLLVQGTVKALDRLRRAGIVQPDEAEWMKDAYLFYRTLESFLRLRGESVIKREEEGLKYVSEFMGFEHCGAFVDTFEKKRELVRNFRDRYFRAS